MNPSASPSIFSWHQTELYQSVETMTLLNKYNIQSIYQYVSLTENQQKVQAFLNQAKANKKQVYFLIGEPEWALDEQATEVIHYIEKVSHYQPLLKGIVLDIEPHTLKEFKENSKTIMTSFVQGLKKAYTFAKQRRFTLIVCLPYYYDTLGFTAELDVIVREAADEIAIMNYYREKEVEHIQIEATLCAQYGKLIHTIYELQPPGKHGLTERNTYYHQGLQAVSQNYQKIQAIYGKLDIGLSFHEYRYFKELAEREVKSRK